MPNDLTLHSTVITKLYEIISCDAVCTQMWVDNSMYVASLFDLYTTC